MVKKVKHYKSLVILGKKRYYKGVYKTKKEALRTAEKMAKRIIKLPKKKKQKFKTLTTGYREVY